MVTDAPKRRWYQFSLKTLLIVTTVATVAFGVWVQYRRQRAQENRERVAAVAEAVDEIEKLGGTVLSECTELRPKTWLEEKFDDPGDADDPVGVWKVSAFFHGITGIQFNNDALKHLKGYSSITVLVIWGTNVTNAGM